MCHWNESSFVFLQNGVTLLLAAFKCTEGQALQHSNSLRSDPKGVLPIFLITLYHQHFSEVKVHQYFSTSR